MHIFYVVSMLLLAVTAANAGTIAFNYNFTAPTLNANQNIVGFDLSVDVFSSKVGKNQSPAAPTLSTILVPNPFIVPTPNCANAPQNCERVPNTTNGVDPKTLQNPQFFYVPNSFAVTKGVDANTNDVLPGIPAGTTKRTDSVALSWEALNFPPTPVVFGFKNQLRFGATVDLDRAFYQPPNTGIGEKPAPKPAYKDAPALKSGSWKLDDGTTVPASQKVAHNIRMGQDALDPDSGIFLAGLGFSYINDAPNEVTLSELSFETSMTELPLDAFGVSGTSLFNPLVTLNGLIQPLLPSYAVPIGATLQFLFPSTNDFYFIARGIASAGSLDELGFAYETLLVAVSEPATWMLVAPFMLLLVRIPRPPTRARLSELGYRIDPGGFRQGDISHWK